MNGVTVADGSRSPADRQDMARNRVPPDVSDVLARHDLVVRGTAVSVIIERPEQDRTGAGWRCRVRVTHAGRRIEHSQVIAPSAGAAVREAVDLVSRRLEIGPGELLSDAQVGLSG